MSEALESAIGKNTPPTCHGGLENLDTEYDYWIDDIEGAVPEDLVGTFFRNGPGRQKIGGVPYEHWFDGDGMLSVFRFDEGRVRFSNRYVRTPKYVQETAARKVLYRGFGTQIPGGWSRNIFRWPTNPANTSVIYHGNHLLTLNEGGRPWEVDPATLATIGEFDYDGKIGKTFSAHGKVHARTGDYFNFGSGTTGFPPKPCIDMYRIDPAGKVAQHNRLLLETFPFCHDFALGDRYAVYFINSIVFSGGMLGFMTGQSSIADAMHFDADLPMRILVVDLDTLECVREFETAPGSIIHFGNAWEETSADGTVTVVVDGMYASDFDGDALANVFDPGLRIGGGTYNRYRLNLGSGAIDVTRMSEHEAEFPTFNPRLAGSETSVCYTACSVPNGADSFFNGFQRVSADGDVDLVTLDPGHYGAEPMFAPGTGATREDDGYLLNVVFDGHTNRSELRVVRADNVNDHVCTLHLKHHVPHQFHGHFTPKLFS